MPCLSIKKKGHDIMFIFLSPSQVSSAEKIEVVMGGSQITNQHCIFWLNTVDSADPQWLGLMLC